MFDGNRRTLFPKALWLPVSLLAAIAVAASTAGAAESLNLEAVKARLCAQKAKIESLHLRIRRQTTLAVDPEVLLRWPSAPALPEHLGTDELLEALKRDKRYRRVLELDYTPAAGAQPAPESANAARPYLDEAKAWTGTVLLERNRNLRTDKYEYVSTPAGNAKNCFPPLEYLANVGLAMPDPTAGDEAHRNLQRTGLLPELLERWPYKVLEDTETVDGAACVVLQGNLECELPAKNGTKKRSLSDKWWLDPQHGLAVRRREWRVDGWLIRVVNREFVEVLPGLWLPRQSLSEHWAPPEAPEEYRGSPVLTCRMSLLLWVINQVPDELFGVTLTRATESPSAFDLAQAHHWRHVRFAREGEQVEEGWALRGAGRRVEMRDGATLRMLVADTPRWHFVWQPERDRVMASPSRLKDPPADNWVRERSQVIQSLERWTAVFACQRDQLDGREVDRLTAHFPADPQERNRWPIHGFDPRVQRRVSGIQSRARTYWFDPDTHLMVQRKCGCEPAKYHVRVDYPPPESLSPERVTFQIPRAGRLEVVDPELGRPVYSEGQ